MMTQSTSSAEPLILLRYSDTLILVDDGLGAEANRLRSALQHFEATCREPGFRMLVSHVADALVQYAQRARAVDLWVRDVGVGFQLAAGGGMYGPVSTVAIGTLWAGSGSLVAGTTSEITDAGRRWLLEHADEYADDVQRGRALLDYLLGFVDTPAERELLDDLFSDASEINDYRELLDEFRDFSKELHSIRGFAYPGEVIVYGGYGVKASLGWATHLTHLNIPETSNFFKLISDGNLLKLSGQSALHEGREALLPSSKLGVAFAVIGLGFTAADNWTEYKNDGVQKVACGTLVDATLDVGLSTLGTAGGAFAGGALLGAGLGAVSGGVLAPVGVAIGSKVGGVLGGMAGSWVSERIQETGFDEWATDNLDAGLDWATDETGAFMADVSENLGGALADASATTGANLSTAAASIENALAPTIQTVVSWL